MSLPFKMDANKTSMRIIIIAMLLFLFLSSAMVFAEPNKVTPEARSSLIGGLFTIQVLDLCN